MKQGWGVLLSRLSVVTWGGVMLLSSCGSLPATSPPTASPPPVPPLPLPSSPLTTTSPTLTPTLAPTAQPVSGKTIQVMIFRVDSQCNQLVSQQITVPVDRSLEVAVGQILDEQATADFELVGYRVQVDREQRQATIDLRLSPTAKRPIAALSYCEQLALFGALRETLTKNRRWQIDTVRFTQLGRDLEAANAP